MIGAILVAAALTARQQQFEVVMGQLRIELARQCPAKHLELIAPRVLLGELDSFKLPADATTRIVRLRRHWQCDQEGSADCANRVSVEVIEDLGRLHGFAKKLCSTWQGCEEQSLCTTAPNQKR